ncbi:MAG: flagellin FliC [Deltaproteobacteria bacterium]|nr:flagellin FliC [Deltaproteobacteria bacterium]MBW1949518.1 flagellin FliC [Deltaproteobacteria bacterium]MBW2346489.1 flagellin FliC [Deltaproteobacteria bacterium]
MGLRINNNIAAFNAHRQLTATDNALSKSIARLSSGLRINQARDDVAGLQIANAFRTDVRGLRMAQQNTAQANAMLQQAEGAANQVETILERLKELATSAASDNTDSAGRTALNAEAGKLINEINRIAADTKYSAVTLINGEGGSLDFQVGTTASSDARITVDLSNVNFTATALCVNSLDLTDKSGAQSAITSVDQGVSVAGTGMGSIGAAQSQLSFASANLATSIENIAASESTIRDADMAFEMISFTRNQILLQAGTAMLAQANLAPQNVLSLFG